MTIEDPGEATTEEVIRHRAPLLRVRDLSVRRGDVLAVDRANLTVDEGAFFVLVGPSGCGKTSLLRAIAGFERPENGSVRLASELLAGDDACRPPERRQIGMVFQDGALFPHLDVLRNVLYGVEGREDGSERAAAALDLVGLADWASRYPDELSGGERQRVALARALAPAPRLLLLDEPFASLDAGLRQRVREEVRSIIDRAETTAVLVTHDQEEALSLADRMAVMVAGRTLQEGAPEAIYRSPGSLEVARFLSGGQLFPCRIREGRARCVLGETATELTVAEGWMLVRPEQIRLAEQGASGVEGVVRRRHFFGHDLIQVVELPGGESVEVRTTPGFDASVGQRVGLELESGAFPVFPG